MSEGYVHAVKKIREADEKVYQQVKSGLLSIPEAKKHQRLGGRVETFVIFDKDHVSKAIDARATV